MTQQAPYSQEAEQSVLGAILLDNAALDRVSQIVGTESFHVPEHRAIFRTVVQLVGDGQVADVITVFERGQHDLAYLNALVTSVPSAAHAHRWAGIVRERALERALIREATAVIESATAAEVGIEAKVDQAQARFAKLAQQRARREPVQLAEAALSFMDHLTDLVEGRDRVIPTGLRGLDKLTAGGLRPGDLWVIGARPSMGKTALSLTMARNMGHRFGTLFLSQEMPVMQLTARHVAALGAVNLADLRQPKDAPDSMWDSVSEAVQRLKSLNVVMDDQGALTLLDVRRKVMSAKRVHGCDAVFVDYLQLMAGDGENRNQELDRISNGLKALAMEFEVGVVLLSQLSRKADERSGPPVMADLRDSGAIEAAADLIGMLHRDFVRNPTAENKHHAQLEVVKQRAGPPGTAHLWFNGEHQQLGDWPQGQSIPKRGIKRGGYDGGLD